jgi:hypothetical protein
MTPTYSGIIVYWISWAKLGSAHMLLGIYNSASLVSTNDNLCKAIRRHTLKSNLLGLTGHAEMERDPKDR